MVIKNCPTCPYCNKELKWNIFSDIVKSKRADKVDIEILGSCKECDYDATFIMTIDTNKEIEFKNIKKFCFC